MLAGVGSGKKAAIEATGLISGVAASACIFWPESSWGSVLPCGGPKLLAEVGSGKNAATEATGLSSDIDASACVSSLGSSWGSSSSPASSFMTLPSAAKASTGGLVTIS